MSERGLTLIVHRDTLTLLPYRLILCAVRLLWPVGNLADWLEALQLTRIAPVESFSLCQIFFPPRFRNNSKATLAERDERISHLIEPMDKHLMPPFWGVCAFRKL